MSTLLVIAKAPVAGRVKTRLCPPLTYPGAAEVAGAALADTLDAVRGTPVGLRVLALAGTLPQQPPDFTVIPQRGAGLGPRLAAAFADAAVLSVGPVLLVGMDTPQLSVDLLSAALALLAGAGAVLGPSVDGGWWALGLQDVRHARVLSEIPMSRCDTADLTLAALRRRGVEVTALPVLRDVDTIADATAVAAAAPDTRFAAALAGALADAQAGAHAGAQVPV